MSNPPYRKSWKFGSQAVMSTLHDLDNTKLATDTKMYKLEIESHGMPYLWIGPSFSAGCARLQSLEDLADNLPDFDQHNARVISCIQGV